MRLQWLPVTMLAVSLFSSHVSPSLGQSSEGSDHIPTVEEPNHPAIPDQEEIPIPETGPEQEAADADAAMSDEHYIPYVTPAEERDAIIVLSDLREAVRTSPRSADDRLKLSQGLYRIGDLDAAIEEVRVAIKLNPDDAKAHLQLGVILIAKQDWRAAASVLKEATRLNPELTQAYYNLGSVQYSSGNPKTAIESYRRALELQPQFPDAKYRLGLLLKLTKQHPEAARLMEEAANAGIPQAQFFLGNAFRSGQGVETNLGLAVFWWSKAAQSEHQAAADALSKLRRQALSGKKAAHTRTEAFDAFKAYRDRLWEEFPDYTRSDDGVTLGTRLLHDNRPDVALPVLLQECYSLSEEAQTYLARLYESGWDEHLAPFDRAILSCLETTAADGFIPAKKLLARIYGKGLGVAQDLKKTRTILKGLPKQEIKSILAELDES